MSDTNELKQRLKETILRDFGNVYRWFDRHAESVEQVDAVDDLEKGELGYDCPPFMGIRQTAEVVLETGFIGEDVG